jgi:aspartate racemase
MKRRVAGVIGGLGPEATLDFFAKVIRHTPASADQEHVQLIINNNPQVPNRNEAVAGTGPSAGPALAESAQALERAGTEFLVMVCNAAHAFEADIRAAVQIPFISIIAETVVATLALKLRLGTVGVLASSGCLDAELYQRAFAAHGLKVVVPVADSRERFMQLLYQIKAGNKGEQVAKDMQELAALLISQGAEVIIAGCTEVPLVLSDTAISVPLVNSTDVLVQTTIDLALGQRELEVE